MSQNLPLGLCFKCIFRFSMLKASVDLPQILWLYVYLYQLTAEWTLFRSRPFCSTKVEVNPRMISTLKNAKSIWSMNPGENFDTSVFGTLGILVALVKRKIGQGSSNSGICYRRPSMSTFMVIETWPKRWWISWERVCFESPQTVGTTRLLSLWVSILIISSWR